MKKIVHVVGARPNFMKVAPIVSALRQYAKQHEKVFDQMLVHTGQHYTPEMSALFFEELGLPEPDINLEVGSGPHGQQTGRIMEAFEPVLEKYQPDSLLVVGDVNSTIACALDAKKMGIKVIHVEAGLRSGDIRMPEEINRILTDAISDVLFTTEPSGNENLKREGVDVAKIHYVGNVMIDSLLQHKEAALRKPTLRQLELQPKGYVLVTMHRPSNVDKPEVLEEIVNGLAHISQRLPVLMPLHPRTAANLDQFNLRKILDRSANVRVCAPMGYLDFLNCTANARMVITDSGGIQEETTILGVPCMTARENTERPITLTEGTNRLIESTASSIALAFEEVLEQGKEYIARTPKFWDGAASERIAKILFEGSPERLTT